MNEDGATKSNGANAFREFSWNPATQLYDRLLRTVLPALEHRLPGHRPLLQGRGHRRHRVAGLHDVGVQGPRHVLGAGRSVLVHRPGPAQRRDRARASSNFDEGERDYKGLQLEMNRSFRDGWVLRTNYTLLARRGQHLRQHLEHGRRGRLPRGPRRDQPGDRPARIPPTSAKVESPQDREHILNVAGAKDWSLGKHTLSLGGLAWFRSGERWGNRPTFAVNSTVIPNIQGTINTSRFIEPRDLRELPETMTLNLNGWSSLDQGVEGTLRAEVANVTDEQENIGINFNNGQPVAGKLAYQSPREYRLQIGVTF